MAVRLGMRRTSSSRAESHNASSVACSLLLCRAYLRSLELGEINLNIASTRSLIKSLCRPLALLVIENLRRLMLTLLLTALVGCGQTEEASAQLEKFTSPAEKAVALHYIDLLRQKKLEEIEKALDPSMVDATTHEKLAHMASLFPAGEPSTFRLVGVQRNTLNNNDNKEGFLNHTFEYEVGGQWLVAAVNMNTQGEKSHIVSFTVTLQPASFEEQTKFTLAGKTPLHYAVLLQGVIYLGITLYALILCIRTKFVGRKWPWVIFVICGVTQFTLNWQTGDWWWNPASVLLFSAGATAQLYSPWIFSLGFPLGAIIFLVRRKKLTAAPSTEAHPS